MYYALNYSQSQEFCETLLKLLHTTVFLLLLRVNTCLILSFITTSKFRSTTAEIVDIVTEIALLTKIQCN